MRLILMEEENLDAEEALQALDEMEMEAFRKLESRARELRWNDQMQAYLHRKGITTEGEEALKLFPITIILHQRKKAAQEELMQTLNEMDLTSLLQQEIQDAEWDH